MTLIWVVFVLVLVSLGVGGFAIYSLSQYSTEANNELAALERRVDVLMGQVEQLGVDFKVAQLAARPIQLKK